MSQMFGYYGKFCATHPWEVIVLVITLTTSLLTLDQKGLTQPKKQSCPGCLEEKFKAIDVIVMTIIRCVAILYTLHQFRNLQKLGSKYILGIAGLFTVFSSFVFTSTVLNLLHIDLVDLKDALFFFLLLIDLSKAATLAQFALTASNQEEISSKIARGMSILGPTITLDTIVEALVIGVGTLSGVYRLEILSYFACLSVIVNYIIFMTFYPACLSLMLELSRISNFYGDNQRLISKMLLEEHEKSNPAVQRVKLIMSIGLLFVHIHSRWNIQDDIYPNINTQFKVNTSCTGDNGFYDYVIHQFNLSTDHIVILILLCTLIIKFVYFENNLINEQIETNENIIIRRSNNSSHILRRQSRLISTNSINTEKEVQTTCSEEIELEELKSEDCRNLEECLQIFRSNLPHQLNDKEIILLVDTKHIPAYNLEKLLNNYERGVKIRRKILQKSINSMNVFINLPYQNYDYTKVMGVCCENVIGYIPIPLGVAGPLNLDGINYFIPMSTTEGCLIASTNRGCRVVEKCGIKSRILSDGMTRGPVVRFSSVTKASEVLLWMKESENFEKIKQHFDSTSRFARLININCRIAGRYLYIRFVAETGDAMGMNMISKGTENSLLYVQRVFPDMEILSLSGNYCTDKKPAAINWIEGRGKSVVCEAVIPSESITTILKTTTETLIELNIAKNIIGSAMAGSIGGYNAHAANIVTAIFIATGQDPAQNVGSSNCITIMEACGENGQDLHMSCTMPSIELGTVGGGTVLAAQSACLEMLGVKGANEDLPGENAKKLSRIVCASVLVGELSLMAALATGNLVKSHLKYNRSSSDKNSIEQACCRNE